MNPTHDETAHTTALNEGVTAYKNGDWAQALSLAAQALAHHADFVPAWMLQARCQVHLGQWGLAREAFAEVLRRDPQHYSAWLEAGHLCKQMGEMGQAVQAYAQAIQVAPQRFEAHLGMARAQLLQGQLAMAERAYADAVKAAQAVDVPTQRQVHRLMGQYLLETGHAQEATVSFSDAVLWLKDVHKPESQNYIAEVQMDWACAMLQLGQREQAMQLLTSSAAMAWQEPTLTRLGVLSSKLNFKTEAVAVLRRCTELFPKSPRAHWHLAHLLADAWQMTEAEKALQKAEKLAPMPEAQSLRAAIAHKLGDAATSLTLYRERLQAHPEDTELASRAALSALHSETLSAQQLADWHRELFAPLGVGARTRASFVRAPLQGRRLKLGLVSPDFRQEHPINLFMQPLLRELDTRQFEVFIYDTGAGHDAQTALAQSRVAQWVPAHALNRLQLAKRIDTDEIDVLVDLSGHTHGHRMSLFAQRAAPVQVSYLGYPGSTGVPNMDFILGDEVVTPKGCENLYTEQVLRLPGTVFCHAPETQHPEPEWAAAMAKRPLTLGSFNTLPKLTPRTLQLWARVLKALPESRLVLKAESFSDEGAKRRIGESLSALGVDLSRVTLRGPSSLNDMMAEYADIDIALDTVPYNGGSTSLQALWMGVPVVTHMGTHFASRMGASFMHAAGLPEWVAQDDDGYVAIVQKMAQDRPALLALKQGLRQGLSAQPAWDIVAHTRAFEQAILQAARSFVSAT